MRLFSTKEWEKFLSCGVFDIEVTSSFPQRTLWDWSLVLVIDIPFLHVYDGRRFRQATIHSLRTLTNSQADSDIDGCGRLPLPEIKACEGSRSG